jgi:hypothetical protein
MHVHQLPWFKDALEELARVPLPRIGTAIEETTFDP